MASTCLKKSYHTAIRTQEPGNIEHGPTGLFGNESCLVDSPSCVLKQEKEKGEKQYGTQMKGWVENTQFAAG